MNNLYFEILERLEENGLYSFIDISDLMDKIPVPVGTPMSTLYSNSTKKAYLESIKRHKHIEFIDFTEDGHNNIFKASAFITPEGLKFIYDYKLTISLIETNKSTRKTYKVVLWSSVVTLALSIATGSISYFNYQLSKDAAEKVHFQRQTQLQASKVKTKMLQLRPALRVDSSHKH